MTMKKLLSVFLLAMCAAALANRVEAQVLVIANPGVATTGVSKSDLRDVFSGAASSLKDGSHVAPVLLKAGPVSDEFLSAYVGKSDSVFRAGWRSLVFSGQASMPRSFESEGALVEFVAHNAGAIGYISKATPHDGVKVLEVR
jgi:ABC-type phosphate transport system substrate-binding protein